MKNQCFVSKIYSAPLPRRKSWFSLTKFMLFAEEIRFFDGLWGPLVEAWKEIPPVTSTNSNRWVCQLGLVDTDRHVASHMAMGQKHSKTWNRTLVICFFQVV